MTLAGKSIADFEDRTQALITLLKELVEQESPSNDKTALDSLGVFLADQMGLLGAKVKGLQQHQHGDHWLGTWGKGPGGILLLTHYDTVYPLGTLAHMPWRHDDEAVYGPGCLDMKSSIAMVFTVIERLNPTGLFTSKRLSLLCTSDEEIGSPSSKKLIEELAVEHELVLCMEPGLPDGALKTWRKGILNFELQALGKSAHAGSDLNAGTNAILEIASQIPKIMDLADETKETTVNIGVIQGGTRSNVVPATCSLQVDVRAKTRYEGERVLRAMESLQPEIPGAEIDLQGGWNRPPMERDELMGRTFQRAASLAEEAGIQLSEGGTGGGSDANFVAGLGVPVLDGLGALGAGAHSPDEKVLVNSLAERCALLAVLISGW